MIHETHTTPRIDVDKVHSLEVISESSWMSPILQYLLEHELPPDVGEERKV